MVPWPQRALLPLFCPHDSSLSAFPLCDSGPWRGGLWTLRPLKGKEAENQILGTSCSGEGGSPLTGVGGDVIPYLALAKVTRGVPHPTPSLNWQPSPTGPPGTQHSALPPQPTGSFGRASHGDETVKAVFLFISSRGSF